MASNPLTDHFISDGRDNAAPNQLEGKALYRNFIFMVSRSVSSESSMGKQVN